MKDLDASEIAAIQSGTVIMREFVTIFAKDRITGSPHMLCFWSDAGPVTVDVVDPHTGSTVSRTFLGDALVEISDIPLISDLSVQDASVTLSAIDDAVQDAIRTYDARNAAIEIHRAYFDPATNAPVAPAKPRFVGQIDTAPLTTAAEGEASTVVLSCTSTTQELTRKNPDVRSHESQILRLATDDFYRDTAVVGEWTLFWGKKQDKATS
jgi:hypothetical protein